MRNLLRVCSALLVLSVALSAAQQGQQGQPPPGPPPTPMTDSKFITTINGGMFREYIIDPTVPVSLVIVGKKAGGDKKFLKECAEAAEALVGYSNFVVMDASSEDGKGIAQMFQINSLPAVALFNPEMLPVQGQPEGTYMKSPAVYNSVARAEDIAKFVLQAIASHQITRLEDQQDTDDLLKKYSANDLSKILLFTKDEVTPPMFKAASHAYRYATLFGLVNVTTPDAEEVAERYDIKTFPTVISVAGSGESAEVDLLVHSEDKPVTLKALDEFVSRVALGEEQRRMLQGQMMQDEIAARKKAQDDAKKVKAMPPITISNEKEWNKECLKRTKGYCVAVFVEDINLPESDLDILTETAKKFASRSSFHSQIAIVDGQANYDIADHFQATNGYPSVVFINPTKKGFHNLIGSFNARSMSTFFVDKATKNKGKPYDPKKVPKFQETKVASEDDDEVISDE